MERNCRSTVFSARNRLRRPELDFFSLISPLCTHNEERNVFRFLWCPRLDEFETKIDRQDDILPPMDKLKGFARRAVAQLGLQHVELPTTENPGYSPVDRDEAKDSERLLASPSPSGESDLTACEKNRASCDCVCHQKGRLLLPPPPRRLMAARINLFASLFWLLGVLLIILAFRVDRSTPANGTFGWCT